jgi:acyl dehydratase
MGVITEEARRWANREYPRFEMRVTATDIARFARATGETNPIYFDPAAAKAAGHPDVVAPTLFPYVIRMHAWCQPISSSPTAPPVPTSLRSPRGGRWPARPGSSSGHL